MESQNTTIVLIGALVVTLLLLMLLAGGFNYLWPGVEKSSNIEAAAQIITPFILVATVVILYSQLGHIQVQNNQIQVQNELQRNVASKSAIQDLNKVLLDEKQDEFLRFVFPTLKEEKAREAMMAFSLMNSLEMLYLTRDKNVDREEFKDLLRGFTTKVRDHWKDSFPTVYHPDFQKIVAEVFAEK